MSSTAMALHLSGALGLVLLGGLVATEGFRGLALRLWGDFVANGRRAPVRAFRCGAFTALALPATTPLASAAIAVGESNLAGVAGALLFACGLSLGAVVTTAWALFGALSPASREVACLLFAAGGAVRWFARSRAIGARGEVLAGAGLALFGMHELADACARIGALGRFDAWNLPSLAGVIVLLAVGAVLAGWLRSTSVVCAAAVAAVAGGALELPSAAALAIGGLAGFARPALSSLRSANADGRRVATGILLHHAIAVGVGLLALPWLLPLAARNESAPWMRAGALALLVGVSAGVSTLVMLSLARPLAGFLDRLFVEHETGVGRPSPLAADLALFPALAVEGGLERVRQLSVLVRITARNALAGAPLTETRREADRAAIGELAHALELSFHAMLERGAPTGSAARLPLLATAARALRTVAERVWILCDRGASSIASAVQPLALRMRQLEMQILHLVEGLDPALVQGEQSTMVAELDHVRARARDLIQRGLEACAAQQIAPGQMAGLIEHVALLEEVGRAAVEVAGCRPSADVAPPPASAFAAPRAPLVSARG